MIIKGLENHLTEYEVRRISTNDYESVYDLQLSNPDYFSTMQENEVTLEECIEGIKALPPGKTEREKYYLGFYCKSKLEVILDLITGYPDKDIAWIGLLMVDCKLSRRGLGKKLIYALRKTLSDLNFQSMQLGVIESNNKALKFWEAMGFNEIRRSETIEENKTGKDVIVMEYILV